MFKGEKSIERDILRKYLILLLWCIIQHLNVEMSDRKWYLLEYHPWIYKARRNAQGVKI